MKIYAVCWLYESQTKTPPLGMHKNDPYKIVHSTQGLSVWDTEEEAVAEVIRINKDSCWVYEVVEVDV